MGSAGVSATAAGEWLQDELHLVGSGLSLGDATECVACEAQSPCNRCWICR
jgi:hypothetical protein